MERSLNHIFSFIFVQRPTLEGKHRAALTQRKPLNYSGCFRYYISPCFCLINFPPTKDFCFQNPGYLSHFQRNPIHHDVQQHQGIMPRNSAELKLGKKVRKLTLVNSRMARDNPFLFFFPPMLRFTYIKMNAASVPKIGTGPTKTTAQPDTDTWIPKGVCNVGQNGDLGVLRVG